MYRAVLIGSLLACLALPASASPGKATPDLEAETQALVQRLVLDRAATIAALQRSADERERRMLTELETEDRRLRSEVGKRKSAQTELLRVTAERKRLVDEIAARDRQFAAEIAEYRKQVASIANSPDPASMWPSPATPKGTARVPSPSWSRSRRPRPEPSPRVGERSPPSPWTGRIAAR